MKQAQVHLLGFKFNYGVVVNFRDNLSPDFSLNSIQTPSEQPLMLHVINAPD
jgi:hypothetical protein